MSDQATMYGTDYDRYLRDSYQMYVEGYNREIDSLPPLTFDSWLESYGESLIGDGIALGLIAPKQ